MFCGVALLLFAVLVATAWVDDDEEE